MSKLQQHLAAVRHAWQRTQILKALAVLLADAVIAVLALVTIDAIYHMAPEVRGTLLATAALAVAITAVWLIVRPLKQHLSDEQVALYIEERFPELQGSLIAAVEYEHRKAENELQTMLFSALMADCLQRAAKMDVKHVIDHRRLRQRAIAAGAMLLFFMGAVVVQPGLFGHELTRVLAPWKTVPLNTHELIAQQKREIAQRAQELLKAQQAAQTQPVKIELTVEPGDTEVRRGSNLVVKATANRVTGPMTLKFLASDGQWRPLEMPEDPNLPDHFGVTLSDLTEASKYKVAMGGVESKEYSIKVFDPTAVKELALTYHYPKYTRMPDQKMANNANIDVLEGTQVDLQFTATAGLKESTLVIEGVGPVAVKVQGDKATASFVVNASSQYTLAATDLRGDKVFGFEPAYAIKANKDTPPTLDVLYPGTDTAVHPLEEIGFAAKVGDDIGIKEVRLVSTYGLEKPVVQKIDGTTTQTNVRDMVGQFMISLAKHPKVETADTITYHFEVEDLKGQVAASDVYLVTVRKIESFATYTAAEGESAREPNVRLMTIIGATHDLEMKRKAMTAEELKKECGKIGKYLTVEE